MEWETFFIYGGLLTAIYYSVWFLVFRTSYILKNAKDEEKVLLEEELELPQVRKFNLKERMEMQKSEESSQGINQEVVNKERIIELEKEVANKQDDEIDAQPEEHEFFNNDGKLNQDIMPPIN